MILLGFATANAAFGDRFGLGPSQGWYLYGRAAQFADCDRFTPPPGTEALCEDTPVSERHDAYYYLFDPRAPAVRLFGAFGNDDELIGQWARRAIRAQPLDYLSTTWEYLRAYWFPNLTPEGGTDLDPQLDFTARSVFEQDIERGLESFYNDFSVHRDQAGLEFLHNWQRVVRFGGTALAITTVLALIGLLVGPRRFRVGVLLFGIGGLALLVAPVLTGNYAGRYTVPMAGPLFAAAAITILALWRSYGPARTAGRGPAGAAPRDPRRLALRASGLRTGGPGRGRYRPAPGRGDRLVAGEHDPRRRLSAVRRGSLREPPAPSGLLADPRRDRDREPRDRRPCTPQHLAGIASGPLAVRSDPAGYGIAVGGPAPGRGRAAQPRPDLPGARDHVGELDRAC